MNQHRFLCNFGVGEAVSGVSPLDGIANIAAAYSTRKLRSAYAGQCLRLRRGSDNAESDFGFTVAGDLDKSAISTWLGGASGLFATWYDQSGNGKNLIQATADAQPLYVASGQNGKPTVRFDNTNDRLGAADVLGGTTLGSATIVCCHKNTNTLNTKRLYGFGAVAVDSQSTQSVHLNMAPDPSLRFDGSAITAGYTQSHPVVFFVRTTVKDGTNYSERFNGASALGSTANATAVNIVDDLYCGTLNLATGGEIAELVFASAVLSAGNITTIENAQAAYYGITF